MPGTLNIGQDDTTAQAFEPNLAAAYCEGRQAQHQGGAQGSNPHTSGSEAFQAWDNGWTKGASSDPIDIGGCAV